MNPAKEIGERSEKKHKTIVTKILSTKKLNKLTGDKKDKVKSHEDASIPKKSKPNRNKSNSTSSNSSSVYKTLSSPEIYNSEDPVPLRYSAFKALLDKLYLLDAINSQGIFRESGHTTSVNIIVRSLRESLPFSNMKTNGQTVQEGVHEYASALKQYLRQAPEPIIPFNDVTRFLQDSENPDLMLRLFRISQGVVEMPKKNQQLLKTLIQFLKRIVENSSVNKMTLNNIAISLGPSVLRLAEYSTFQQTGWCCEILGLLISYYEDIFGGVESEEEYVSPRPKGDKCLMRRGESDLIPGSLRPGFSSDNIQVEIEDEEEEEMDLFEFLRCSSTNLQANTVLL
eukprot:TRINITY_DN4573_c0_g1_i1.p1 TRINITY_DN4573_c0_g1~~TRINITY_DN4573_c0_g1_i1.p1  ORF type:complete len:341 (+),score=57.88 TRINITY_DN4573_c0_g1_i1:42-1064(+)